MVAGGNNKTRRWRVRGFLGASMVAVIAAVVAYVFMPSWHQVAKPAAATPVGVVTTSTDQPAEEPITTYHSTAVGAQPKYIRLPTIKTEGFIQAVGIDQHQQIAVPTNIHLAGWFTGGVTPGDPGLSIIDGHLDGRTGSGIFASLGSLRPGDSFTVDLANGATRRFKVRQVQSLPVNEAAASLFSQIPGVARQLNLITCGGVYHQANGYDHRVIVSASLVN